MKVRCIANRGVDLPVDLLTAETRIKPEKEFPLKIGKIYVVYAFTVSQNYLWYYICDEMFSYAPFWRPAPLFDIVDHRLSKYWQVNYSKEGRCESKSSIIVAYPEWASDIWYYDHLSENDEKAVAIFNKYKTLIDDEFA